MTIDNAKFRLYRIEEIRTYMQPHVKDIDKAIKLFELGVRIERKAKEDVRKKMEKKRYRIKHAKQLKVWLAKWRKANPNYSKEYMKKYKRKQ